MLPIGTTMAGAGVAIGVPFWIYVKESDSNDSFWSAPGYVSLAILAIGLVALLAGLVSSDEGPGRQQVQRSGRDSKNYQAGRDIRVEGDNDDEE